MDNIRFKRIVFIFIIVIIVSVLAACDYNTPTIIYTDDENGLAAFENEYEIQLLSTDFAEDGSWIEYHFSFVLKKEYSKKFLITIDNFKLREGDESFNLKDSLASGYISSYSEVITIKLDDVEQDEIYQYLAVNVLYSLDVKIAMEPLETSCQVLNTICDDLASYENGIQLSFDGRSIWFGDLDYLA
ncbi:MAG: hypothetical protein UT30_C0048G0004 [Candidatus Uhrbacteria bacterium GW2011_GWF2_39_13]|uniref:Uncharacterized protein n=1 Tax=Candidatus Uhrbacteria bacterium GW2011_GWF2_39_13 TaxID=1618995 RepID=A0A0G0MFI0_9BACT|nr:MAG: hypothetical protein UT30_C0048G0004 [Candidatus Uhrbacteria bacterium GW2011_GWF2_39_13]